jgi:hypothetical protein
MMRNDNVSAFERAETVEALPTVLSVLRRIVISTFEPGDPESDELRHLLDACVVGAHRLRLREQLRASETCDQR